MLAVQLSERELATLTSETDSSRRLRVDFPISSLAGAQGSSVVYFEVDPGDHIGMHTDSAEEIILVLSGRAEATIGDETGQLAPGGMGLIPALVPHDVHNVGEGTLRVVGFFSSSTVVSVFDDPMMPGARRVVGTPMPAEAEAEVAPVAA